MQLCGHCFCCGVAACSSFCLQDGAQKAQRQAFVEQKEAMVVSERFMECLNQEPCKEVISIRLGGYLDPSRDDFDREGGHLMTQENHPWELVKPCPPGDEAGYAKSRRCGCGWDSYKPFHMAVTCWDGNEIPCALGISARIRCKPCMNHPDAQG